VNSTYRSVRKVICTERERERERITFAAAALICERAVYHQYHTGERVRIETAHVAKPLRETLKER
jgi:hypothetical protein